MVKVRYFILLLSLISVSSCQEKERPSDSFLDNCNASEQTKSKTISTPKFVIDLPVSWQVDLGTPIDSMILFGMDTTAFLSNNSINTILVRDFKIGKSLKDHFTDEITGMQKDSINVIQTGSFTLDNRIAFWCHALIDDNAGTLNELYIYTNDSSSGYIIVFDLRFSKAEDVDTKICLLKRLIKEVKFNSESAIRSLHFNEPDERDDKIKRG